MVASGFRCIARVRARDAEVIMRAGAQLQLNIQEVLPDGSWIAHLNEPGKPSVKVRVIEYSVTANDTVTGEESIGETVTLITSLLDHERYPIGDFPDLYRQRWTSETVFDEVKTDLRGGCEVVFHSTSRDGVLAEFWGRMCLYQGISDVVDHVVLDAGLPPEDAVGFKAATSFVRRSVTWTDAAASRCSGVRRRLSRRGGTDGAAAGAGSESEGGSHEGPEARLQGS
ncbi:transposase [Glycomyces tenuis]|uniref:transposase n=1 Tax=Glycomyces tenuis TaxID=58116 RepID=UPI00316AD15B